MSDRICDHLRQQIVFHEIRPGDPIRQDVLAADLGVSKIPVREALARLEGGGMIQYVANRGFVATPLSADEAKDIFMLRQLLEPELAAVTCASADESQRGQVSESVQALADLPGVRESMNARRVIMISLLHQASWPTATRFLIELFDRSERYHPPRLTPEFVDLGSLHELVEAWLARDAKSVRRLYHERLRQRAESALAIVSEVQQRHTLQ